MDYLERDNFISLLTREVFILYWIVFIVLKQSIVCYQLIHMYKYKQKILKCQSDLECTLFECLYLSVHRCLLLILECLDDYHSCIQLTNLNALSVSIFLSITYCFKIFRRRCYVFWSMNGRTTHMLTLFHLKSHVDVSAAATFWKHCGNSRNQRFQRYAMIIL